MSLIKTTHASSQAAQSAKLRRLGAMGSLKLARKAEHAPRKYASGGMVGDAGPVDGAAAKPRLDRPGRKMGKDKGKKGGTNVNVIIMPKGGDGPSAPPPMPMPPPGAGPGPGGPGGPPMPPMRKHGGAVGRYAAGGRIANLGKYAHGGKVRKGKAEGGKAGESDVDVRQSAQDRADKIGNQTQSKILRGVTGGSAVLHGILGSVGNKLQRSGNLPAAAVQAVATGLSHLGIKGAEKEKAEAEKSAAGEERKNGGRTGK